MTLPRLSILIVAFFIVVLSSLAVDSSSRSAAPIFELEDEAKGFYGTIGERNVLVDLKPHLQIKNIDAISMISSFFLFY